MDSEDFQVLGDSVKGLKILHLEVGVAKPEVLKAFRGWLKIVRFLMEKLRAFCPQPLTDKPF